MILQSVPELSNGFYFYSLQIPTGFRFEPTNNSLIWYISKNGSDYAILRSVNPIDNIISKEPLAIQNITSRLRGRRNETLPTT